MEETGERGGKVEEGTVRSTRVRRRGGLGWLVAVRVKEEGVG